MSELNEMGCREFSDISAELALGVLTGRERAQALAHLDHCASCREEVRQLTATGEGLLGLLPSVEPPAGFEARVMDRLGLAPPAPSPERHASWTSRIALLGRKPAGRSATGQPPPRPGRPGPAGRANPPGAGPRGRRTGRRRGWPGRVGPAARHPGSSRDPAELRHPALRQPPGSGKDLPLRGQFAVAVHVRGHALRERHRDLRGGKPRTATSPPSARSSWPTAAATGAVRSPRPRGRSPARGWSGRAAPSWPPPASTAPSGSGSSIPIRFLPWHPPLGQHS